VNESPRWSRTHVDPRRLAARAPGSKGQILSARGAGGPRIFSDGSPIPNAALTTQYDRDAVRLLLAVDGGCEPGAPFPTQVEASLAALLTLFDSDPALARRLTSLDRPPPLGARACRWKALFAARLRASAERAPGLRLPPPFVEPILIDGLAYRLGRELRSDSPDLLALLPSMLEFVLVYYLDPAEFDPLIATARTAAEASGRPRLDR
jgi:hypothetical protein